MSYLASQEVEKFESETNEMPVGLKNDLIYYINKNDTLKNIVSGQGVKQNVLDECITAGMCPNSQDYNPKPFTPTEIVELDNSRQGWGYSSMMAGLSILGVGTAYAVGIAEAYRQYKNEMRDVSKYEDTGEYYSLIDDERRKQMVEYEPEPVVKEKLSDRLRSEGKFKSPYVSKSEKGLFPPSDLYEPAFVDRIISRMRSEEPSRGSPIASPIMRASSDGGQPSTNLGDVALLPSVPDDRDVLYGLQNTALSNVRDKVEMERQKPILQNWWRKAKVLDEYGYSIQDRYKYGKPAGLASKGTGTPKAGKEFKRPSVAQEAKKRS
jgi:hypothetical protein